MKFCEICKKEKDEKDFARKKDICRKCRVKENYNRFRLMNPDKMKSYSKKYYNNNKDKIIESNTIYYENNKDHILELKKEYHSKNKDNICLSKKEKYNTDVEYKSSKLEYNKKYYKDNKEWILLKNVSYKRNKINTDELYKISHYIRGVVNSMFYRKYSFKKNKRTEDILGCTYDEFKLYIESKFEPWMTWENRGLYNGELNYGWDIDHIIPLSNAKNEEELIKLSNYKNLQPLCSYINRYVKKNKLNQIIKK